MPKNTRIVIASIISGCFLLLDQFLKYLALHNPEYSAYLIEPWLGWEYYENLGIAFSLPFPNTLLILITPLIILWLANVFIKTYDRAPFRFQLGILLATAGAISNFIDRVIQGFTVDYFRIFTSIINIADIMIVAGAFLLAIFYSHFPITEKDRSLTHEPE